MTNQGSQDSHKNSKIIYLAWIIPEKTDLAGKINSVSILLWRILLEYMQLGKQLAWLDISVSKFNYLDNQVKSQHLPKIEKLESLS